MKKLLIILSMVLMPIFAFATVTETNGNDAVNQTIQSMAPAEKDTIIVQADDTLEITGSWQAGTTDTTCSFIYVRQDGVLRWTGNSRANIAHLWLGNKGDGDPWDIDYGGTLELGASDTLALWKLADRPSSDYSISGDGDGGAGADAQVTIDGGSWSTMAVIMGMEGQEARPSPVIWWNDNQFHFNASYCKFRRLGDTTGYPGLSYWTVASDVVIENCIFDSAFYWSPGGDGDTLLNCSLFMYEDANWPVVSIKGDFETRYSIKDCDFIGNQENVEDAGERALLGVQRLDSLTIDGCTFVGINGNFTNDYVFGLGIDADDIDTLTIRSCVFDTFTFCISLVNITEGMIEDNLIGFGRHEGLIYDPNDGDNTVIQNNQFYGTNSALGHLLFYFDSDGSDDGENPNISVLYNTFASEDGEISLMQWGSPSPPDASGFTISGWDIIGNAFAGAGSDITLDDSTHIVCDEFKHNAYDSIGYDPNSDLIISGSAYSIPDSNLNDQSSYGFLDSIVHDYRLADGSPMIDAADSVYWVQVYIPADSSTAPGNIGYYQVVAGIIKHVMKTHLRNVHF